MLVRILRFSDRLGRIIIKSLIWFAERVVRRTSIISLSLQERFAPRRVVVDPATRETRISSLSIVVVVLLVGFITVLLWTTNVETDSPIIRFFSIGATPQPESDSGSFAAAPGVNADAAFLGARGTVVFSMLAGSQNDLFALTPGSAGPVRLTVNPADDRDPSWSPDGSRIAFASRRAGNWDIYVMNVLTGEIQQLTDSLVFEAGPTWSPDNIWLAYEAYYEGNLDIYVIKADGSEGPYPVTRNPSADFSPAWSKEPSGRELAYVSRRGGDQDIYLISLDDPSEERAINVTQTADANEAHPTWSPDGKTLAYSSNEDGISLVYALSIADAGAQPVVIGQGKQPAWSPDGQNLVFLAEREDGSLLLSGQYGSWNASVQAFALPAVAASPDWSTASLPAAPRGEMATAITTAISPAYEEVVADNSAGDAPYLLYNLPGVITDSPYLSDRVDGSFSALRIYTNQTAGWDFLGRLNDAWWPIDRRPEPGEEDRSWHKSGRAISIVQTYNEGNPPQIEVVPYEVGPDVYWRIYLRCSVQDGSLGEPLREVPWDFGARSSGDVAAYEAGGRFKDAIPQGYYIDFTSAAATFGWRPVPSGSAWRYNWPAIRFWEYEKRDNLDWWAAMREVYAEQELLEAFDS